MVIPVYQGERSLGAVIDELVPLTDRVVTPGGAPYRITEVLLVHDHGPDGSAVVMRKLEGRPASSGRFG